MIIDPGTPAPWVKVEPFGPDLQTAAGFSVKCDRCGAWEAAYLPVEMRDPGTVARLVAQHNRCEEGE